MSEQVKIEKLVQGGQGLATLSDGRKIFIWNVLPGEVVEFNIIKNKRQYAEAIATNIINESKYRILPKDYNFLATSPWQIININEENKIKKMITREIFLREVIELESFEITSNDREFNYRNKMEYSFWGDEEGIHLALHSRGSHQKEIVEGSALAMPGINKGAISLLQSLNKLGVRAAQLKSVIIRCTQENQTVAALFVKDKTFPKMTLPSELAGLQVYFSDPKSPASIVSGDIQELGSLILKDRLLDMNLSYRVDSFFQINVPVFEQVLKLLSKKCKYQNVVDMYSGVGAIGLSIASKSADLIDVNPINVELAKKNASESKLKVNVIKSSVETALQYINTEKTVIFDPPRAGLNTKIINTLISVKPKEIVYLSCNPVTQARDVKFLNKLYKIKLFEIFNFFPHTPHIESLAILSLI